jgi:hypothetical protein
MLETRPCETRSNLICFLRVTAWQDDFTKGRISTSIQLVLPQSACAPANFGCKSMQVRFIYTKLSVFSLQHLHQISWMLTETCFCPLVWSPAFPNLVIFITMCSYSRWGCFRPRMKTPKLHFMLEKIRAHSNSVWDRTGFNLSLQDIYGGVNRFHMGLLAFLPGRSENQPVKMCVSMQRNW